MVNTSQTFLALDEADYFILRCLSDRYEDFRSLSPIDQKIVVWMLTNKPDRLEGWISYLINDYKKHRPLEYSLDHLTDHLCPLSVTIDSLASEAIGSLDGYSFL